MKQIVTWSLECVQDMMENRKNSHELYGYDFMIDENYIPWLIEINSSPAMDYSTVGLQIIKFLFFS
jgi:tubulin monoglycylase TTLL3/8